MKKQQNEQDIMILERELFEAKAHKEKVGGQVNLLNNICDDCLEEEGITAAQLAKAKENLTKKHIRACNFIEHAPTVIGELKKGKDLKQICKEDETLTKRIKVFINSFVI